MARWWHHGGEASGAALHAAQAHPRMRAVSRRSVKSASIAHRTSRSPRSSRPSLPALPPQQPDLDDVGTVEWILKAGDRASEVIQRLRASSKSEPQLLPLDVNEIVDEVLMLQREPPRGAFRERRSQACRSWRQIVSSRNR